MYINVWIYKYWQIWSITFIFFYLQDFPLSSGPDGPMGGPMGPNTMGPVMNGDGLDGMKNSPANGPGTPRDDGGGMGDYNLGSFGGPPESVSFTWGSSVTVFLLVWGVDAGCCHMHTSIISFNCNDWERDTSFCASICLRFRFIYHNMNTINRETYASHDNQIVFKRCCQLLFIDIDFIFIKLLQNGKIWFWCALSSIFPCLF